MSNEVLINKLIGIRRWTKKNDENIIVERISITNNIIYYNYIDNPLPVHLQDSFSGFLSDFKPYQKETIGRKDDSNKPKAVELLETSAATLIRCGKKYDSTGNNSERIMDRVTEAYTAITGEPMTPEQANIFMVCLKLVRSQTSSYHDDDHYIDGINYFAMAGESASEAANK